MNTQEKVMVIVAEVCGVDATEVSINTSIGDFSGWDSMGQLTILSKVEEEFDVSFEPEEMMEIEDVKDIVNAVEGKL